jgi:hypothetical protein
LYLGSFPLRSTVTFTAFPAMSLIPLLHSGLQTVQVNLKKIDNDYFDEA